MNEVIVSPKAEEAYHAMLEYYVQFSVEFALKLAQKFDQLVENLQRHRKLCPTSRTFPNLRRCVLTENISLVYKIEGRAIHIVAVYDSRTDHLF